MTILDKCKQIIDTESGRVLLYRDEVEAVLTAGDTISRRQAIDALGDEPEVWTGKDEYAQGLNNQWHYDVNALKTLPSAQPEYTENEEKVLVMMFTIVKNILDLQDGYMNIDDMSFGHNELFNLSEKLGIDY